GHDIIFGLPFQTLENIEQTILKTKELLPDRLAFYSYAHVPWIKGNGQRGFNEDDLPTPEVKRKQYELGKKWLTEVGYTEIGMDHFALPTDSLYLSMVEGELHRNFMGYTASKTQVMIGLGVSAISDGLYGFSQNEKNLEAYYRLLKENMLPVYRGHILNEEDLVIRKHILNLMCRFKTSWTANSFYFKELPEVISRLREMEIDGLINIASNSIEVTKKGQPFVRNICMAFDLLLQRNQPHTNLFSMTV
ncbi:MAG: coproporphyrinogen III oxidase, partial [Flavobacteriales bacterium]